MSAIRLTSNRDCASVAAAYDANPPATPPNSRNHDIISALAGAHRRPLGAAVAQSCAIDWQRSSGEHQTNKWLTQTVDRQLNPEITEQEAGSFREFLIVSLQRPIWVVDR